MRSPAASRQSATLQPCFDRFRLPETRGKKGLLRLACRDGILDRERSLSFPFVVASASVTIKRRQAFQSSLHVWERLSASLLAGDRATRRLNHHYRQDSLHQCARSQPSLRRSNQNAGPARRLEFDRRHKAWSKYCGRAFSPCPP